MIARIILRPGTMSAWQPQVGRPPANDGIGTLLDHSKGSLITLRPLPDEDAAVLVHLLLISNQSCMCKELVEAHQRHSLRFLSRRSRAVRAMSDTQSSDRRCGRMRGQPVPAVHLFCAGFGSTDHPIGEAAALGRKLAIARVRR